MSPVLLVAVALAASPAQVAPSAPPTKMATVEQADAAIMDHYPAAARASGVEGWADVKCPTQDASACVVVAEGPAGAGFGQAALAVARLWPAVAGDDTPLQDLSQVQHYAFSLHPPAILPNPLRPLTAITRPNFAGREDFSKMGWPAVAYYRAVSGTAVLDCVVTYDGKLDPCVVTDESPPGWGFGHAAMTFAATFKMKPMLRDGQPVGGAHMRIPFAYSRRPGSMSYGGNPPAPKAPEPGPP